MAAARSAFSADPPRVLSIAGSDPSGGAGIQADLKTFTALGCYGLSVLTSLTAQNTTGVQQIHTPPVDFCKAQLQALWNDVEINAIKIGMLATTEVVLAIADELESRRHLEVPVVLDPVMVSTSGSLLLTESSIRHLIERLLPLCAVLTPNLPEAEQLLRHAGQKANSNKTNGLGANSSTSRLSALLSSAKELCDLGPQATLVKGGHQILSRKTLSADFQEIGLAVTFPAGDASEAYMGASVYRGTWDDASVTIVRTDIEPHTTVLEPESSLDENGRLSTSDDVVADVLYEKRANAYTIFIKRHVQSSATHGTGCTLSSAIAAHLASARSSKTSTVNSVYRAITYVQRAISRGLVDFGRGSGPLNHLCSITPRGIYARAPNSKNGAERNPLCAHLISHSLPLWNSFTRHGFIEQLAQGTLPRDAFVYFLRQDYLFLKHYARVWASGASSFSAGNTFERIGFFAGVAAEMVTEADNHVKICESVWGISRYSLEYETKESAATLAYTRFVLDVSKSGDALDLLIATGPCLLGYGEAGQWAASQRHASNLTESVSSTTTGFKQWIDYYSGENFQDVVAKGVDSIEAYAAQDPPSPERIAHLQRIWNAAVRLEIGMWDEAIEPTLRREVL